MIKKVHVKAFNKMVMVEKFESTNDLVEANESREITDSSFSNMKKKGLDPKWHSVSSYEEAMDYMKNGYQPIVDELKKGLNVDTNVKRIQFYNDVVGYSPIVPLVLMGVPTAMQNSRMVPIKSKVIDIYYDMSCSSATSVSRMLEAGKKLLKVIMELEMKGYKFNLYAVQSYSDDKDADMLCVKIKSSNTPIDLKRMAFSLTHTAFFRVIGFDWASKTPQGRYRYCYGRALGNQYTDKEISDGFKELLGKNAVTFSCARMLRTDEENIKSTLTAEDKGGISR